MDATVSSFVVPSKQDIYTKYSRGINLLYFVYVHLQQQLELY